MRKNRDQRKYCRSWRGGTEVKKLLIPLNLPRFKSVKLKLLAQCQPTNPGIQNYRSILSIFQVFQCSPDDMHLVMAPTAPAPVPPPPPLMLPQRPTFVPNIPTLVPMSAPMFWPYPSPPVSPNMVIPGQVNQLVVYGIGPNVGLPDIIAHFQTPDVVVENVMFTRVAQGNIPGEAVVTIRSRTPSDPPVVAIDPQFLQKVPIDAQFVPGAVPMTLPQALPPQPIYTLIQS
ncbi:hypothetical protein Y032_0431g1337 [Ancylostoma ceylanicum]|uniref:RRM domain-containing protein n=1 Tax=Ancylostoma ceylanicum TaxID=53326 RepID=A0A016X1G5_9BILA|nr:hypothetical protein Y032_0431g1337 [Ancylostoma ceylanicum]